MRIGGGAAGEFPASQSEVLVFFLLLVSVSLESGIFVVLLTTPITNCLGFSFLFDASTDNNVHYVNNFIPRTKTISYPRDILP